jgi:hypothetical protein
MDSSANHGLEVTPLRKSTEKVLFYIMFTLRLKQNQLPKKSFNKPRWWAKTEIIVLNNMVKKF